MDKRAIQDQYWSLRDAWQRKDFGLALERAAHLLDGQPNHEAALRVRLKAALRLADSELVAKFSPAVVPIDVPLALAAASKLAQWGDHTSAAALYSALLASPALKTLPPEIQANAKSIARSHVAVLLANADRLHMSGDISGALRLWHAGLRLSPTHSGIRKRVKSIRELLIDTARRVDPTDQARHTAASERILEADPLHPTTLKKLAAASEARGDYRAAVKYWTTLTRVKTEQKRAVDRLVRAATKADCEFDALKYIHASGLISLVDPDFLNRSGRHLLHLSKVLMRQNSPQTAAPILGLLRQVRLADDTLVPATERCAKLVFRAMWAARKNNEWETAVTLARHLIALDPDNRNALEVLGRYAFRNRAFNEATDFFRQLIKSSPTDQKGWRWLAEALRKSGNNEEAAEALAQQEALGGPPSATASLANETA